MKIAGHEILTDGEIIWSRVTPVPAALAAERSALLAVKAAGTKHRGPTDCSAGPQCFSTEQGSVLQHPFHQFRKSLHG